MLEKIELLDNARVLEKVFAAGEGVLLWLPPPPQAPSKSISRMAGSR